MWEPQGIGTVLGAVERRHTHMPLGLRGDGAMVVASIVHPPRPPGIHLAYPPCDDDGDLCHQSDLYDVGCLGPDKLDSLILVVLDADGSPVAGSSCCVGEAQRHGEGCQLEESGTEQSVQALGRSYRAPSFQLGMWIWPLNCPLAHQSLLAHFQSPWLLEEAKWRW